MGGAGSECDGAGSDCHIVQAERPTGDYPGKVDLAEEGDVGGSGADLGGCMPSVCGMS